MCGSGHSMGTRNLSIALFIVSATSETRSSASSFCSAEGNTMTLSCLISNEPLAKYSWTKNSKTVNSSNSAFKIEGHKLIVNLKREEDFGTFECNVTNNEGRVVFTTNRYEVTKCLQDGNQCPRNPGQEPQGNQSSLINDSLFSYSVCLVRKDTVIRGTKSCNSSRNIVALQVTERMLLVLPPCAQHFCCCCCCCRE